MKQFNKFGTLFNVIAIIMVFTIVNINSAYAQGSSASPSPTASPEPTPYKKVRKHKDQDLEDLRGKITDVFLTVEDASNTITPVNANAQKSMKAAKDKLAAFTLDDLDQLRDSIDPAEMDADLQDAKDKLAKIKPAMKAAYAQFGVDSWKTSGDNDLSDDSAALKSTLPGIADPDLVCKTLIGMGKAQLDVIVAANAAYIAAKILSIALDRGCNQVIVAGVVVLGNVGVGGGNSSLACIVSDGLLLVADTLRDRVSYCDTDFTRRSVDTAVERMETVHTDLDLSVANDNLNKTAIVTNATTNTTTITGAVDSAKTLIDGNATINKNTIVADALANKNAITGAINSGTTTITTAVGDGTSTILSNDNTNKNTIVTNDNGNRVLMFADAKANKEFLLRTQIEADLSSTDGATFVAMFLTPVGKCFPVLNDRGESSNRQPAVRIPRIEMIFVGIHVQDTKNSD